VANGGFEVGTSETAPFQGTAVGGGDAAWIDGALASWEVGPSTNNPNVFATNRSVYYATISNGQPAGGGPHSGNVAAVFPNTPLYNGYISQAVSGVVAGNLYKISFWLSNQVGDATSNSMDVKWGGTIASPGGTLTGGISLAGGTPPIPGPIPVQVAWTYYEFNVTAPENNARLTFIGGSTVAANLIDDVSVVQIPEPTTLIMLGAGMLLMGLPRHRLERSADRGSRGFPPVSA